MKIYFSRSNEVDDSAYYHPLDIIKGNLNCEVTMYKRGSSYNPQLLEEADIVIVGVSDYENKKATASRIAKGCCEELKKALQLNKPIFFLSIDISTKRWFLQKLREKDIVIVDPNTWQLGYAQVSRFTQLSVLITHNLEGCIGCNITHVRDLFKPNLKEQYHLVSTTIKSDESEENDLDDLLLLG